MSIDLKSLANKTLERVQKRTLSITIREQVCSPSIEIPYEKIIAREQKNWTKEDDFLIQWFLTTEDLPLSPFELKKSVRVVDGEKFYKSLREDVDQGRKSPRALFGAIQEDIKCLKEISEEHKKALLIALR